MGRIIDRIIEWYVWNWDPEIRWRRKELQKFMELYDIDHDKLEK